MLKINYLLSNWLNIKSSVKLKHKTRGKIQLKNNNIEITKSQLIELLSSQLIQFNLLIERQKKVMFEMSELWSSRKMSIKEGVMLITPYHKNKDNSLLIKMWESEQDIPNVDIWKDNSENVRNLLMSDDSCKYFISYRNHSGLKIIIKKLNGNENVIGTRRTIYSFSLITKQI